MQPPSPTVAASVTYGCSLRHLRLQVRHGFPLGANLKTKPMAYAAGMTPADYEWYLTTAANTLTLTLTLTPTQPDPDPNPNPSPNPNQVPQDGRQALLDGHHRAAPAVVQVRAYPGRLRGVAAVCGGAARLGG